MTIDTIIFAVVAAFLVYRLRSVLGTRHGDEPPRMNPFAAPQEGAAEAPRASVGGAPGTAEPEMASAKNSPLQATLMEIHAFDPFFSPEDFRRGAGEAYKMIVQAFAAGDRTTLKPLLSPALYSDFDRAISGRESRGETSQAEVSRIKHSEITDARIEGKTAYVTVEFTAAEKTITRDREGKIIAGDDEDTQDMIDIWTFARSLRSKDPNWTLVATRAH